MAEEMVTVPELKNSVGLRGGQLYGPGTDVKVPKSLADGLGLAYEINVEDQEDRPSNLEPNTGDEDSDFTGKTADQLEAEFSADELRDEAERRGLDVKKGAKKADYAKALAS